MSALKFVQLLDELSKYTNFEKLPEALLQSSVFNNSQFAQWLMRLQMQILHGCACARIAYFTVFFGRCFVLVLLLLRVPTNLG